MVRWMANSRPPKMVEYFGELEGICGTLVCSDVERAVLPASLRNPGAKTFEEVALPGTVREMGAMAFSGCGNLKVVWVGEGFSADIRWSFGDSVATLKVGTTVGG